jgi:hypothetical protein
LPIRTTGLSTREKNSIPYFALPSSFRRCRKNLFTKRKTHDDSDSVIMR